MKYPKASQEGMRGVQELSSLSRDLHPELMCVLGYPNMDNTISLANCISSTHLMNSARKGKDRLYNQEPEQTYTASPLPAEMKCLLGSAIACPFLLYRFFFC